ncbi:MAG: type I restriction enzyme HsdR N-terminal domain-containing protein [Proteobacteria bacterium]|nr:type I restriction enzyme HsdR N-terminal domain-containing protein [Pseudomonadota bacterium]
MKGHHLILGKTTDWLTGEVLDDTLDERLRQKIARFLVEEKGHAKEDIRPRLPLKARAGEREAVVTVDFTVTAGGRTAMIVRFGPGSIVTRHRPGLAASRLVAPYQVPVVVVTNGEDADILDGATGKVLGHGLPAIPGQEELARLAAAYDFPPVPPERREKEGRILHAFEAVGACNCED